MGRLERARQPRVLERHTRAVLRASTRPRRARSWPSSAKGRWSAARAPRRPGRSGSRACSGTAASTAAGSGSSRSTRTSRQMTRSAARRPHPLGARADPPLPRPVAQPRRGERVGRPGRPVPAGRDPRLPPPHGGRRRGRGRALLLARPERGGPMLERDPGRTAHARAGGRAAPGGPTGSTPRAWARACRPARTRRRWRCSASRRTVAGAAQVLLARNDRAPRRLAAADGRADAERPALSARRRAQGDRLGPAALRHGRAAARGAARDLEAADRAWRTAS